MEETKKEETKEEKKAVKENTEKKEVKEKDKKSHKKALIIVLIVVLILALCSVIFAVLNINNNKIMKGVTINGVDISCYTKEELKEQYKDIIEKNNTKIIELKYKDQQTDITPEGLGTTYNIDEIVEEAYSIGRRGNIFVNNFDILKTLVLHKDFKLEGTVNDKSLEDIIYTLNGFLEDAIQEVSYYIDEDVLYIIRGKEGNSVNEKQLKRLIEEKIDNFSQDIGFIDIPTTFSKPKDIDIEKIYSEIYSEPQDAYITNDPLTIHPNVDGVDFAITMEEAKAILAEDKEEYEIPLKITKANKTLADLGKEAFPNELGKFYTKFDVGNASRTNNIKLATNKINGVIVLPGETFSYNKTVGKRTIDNGFREAGAYVNGQVVQEVGGGICQVSSTLYNAVLYANLEVVERHNHTFESSYVAASRDATVSWGGPDFKFKNNRTYPVRIVASSNNGTETVSIYGIKEDDDYEVIIQSRKLSTITRKTEYVDDSSLAKGEEVISQNGHDGCTSEAIKILRKDGKTISTTVISRDTYIALAMIIRRGTKEVSDDRPSDNQPADEPDEPNLPPEDPDEPEIPDNPDPVDPGPVDPGPSNNEPTNSEGE